MAVKSIRGAIQVNRDSKEDIKDAVKKLIDTIFYENSLDSKNLISVFFSQTGDLKTYNPAKAAREAGYSNLSYFCLQELYVEGGMERVIRVLLHVESSSHLTEFKHVYLNGAEKLRPDLCI
ncbi:MAG: chorismate mutase [Spirochaetia bacterium]|nr:chorismate mutase [Spirochaetia bacterium]